MWSEENCIPNNLPQPQFLAHRVQLSVHQGGVEYGHDHLYDTDRYGSRLTIELSAIYVAASYQPLSCRKFTILSFTFLSSRMFSIKNVLKTCKLPKCKGKSCSFNSCTVLSRDLLARDQCCIKGIEVTEVLSQKY